MKNEGKKACFCKYLLKYFFLCSKLCAIDVSDIIFIVQTQCLLFSFPFLFGTGNW